MNAKGIVTVLLLMFVGVSVAYMVITESDSVAPTETVSKPGIAAPATPVVDEQEPTKGDRQQRHKLVAYYFHRTQRCRKCLTIEAYAEETLKEAFSNGAKEIELEWRAVNVEEPVNEHFVEDYALTSGALVLVDAWDGRQREWRNLEKVWELVGDELKFKAYVEAEALALLENGS
ncbi:MAG: nitrophenyl compound nitroreductase subunit ArsF family protein [Planctomycetota bacterium]|jgi:hypothetical protein